MVYLAGGVQAVLDLMQERFHGEQLQLRQLVRIKSVLAEILDFQSRIFDAL